ncbi:ABC transporter ATP-binding protein [Acetobacter thailandicus]|uniref:ABC transporter ATP-binding protein n=1 Tax=Acetobacter thailandicus TaxID=1502842 RepID=UPI001BA47DF1|nr:ABC transporter ATP-binding protein [Acetobacter thailandicus]MBS0961376.1 ABC transporter ATP-binding protein [Acetobacter thailandicus]
MLIELSHIQRLYRSEEVETSALHDIDFSVKTSEFVAIMGPSGCGKSTFLNILGTIDRPTSGSYRFEEKELTTLNEATLAAFRRENLGYIFQNFNLIDDLTIERNIELALTYRNIPKSQRRERIAWAMDHVGIAHRAKHYPSQLSGGQQQRAAIARAIVGKPKLILADEPTGNLDTENGSQVMDILQRLNDEGATIIMVTHSPGHADLAGRRVDILDGRIVLSVSAAL